jgi:hypothetical protein
MRNIYMPLHIGLACTLVAFALTTPVASADVEIIELESAAGLGETLGQTNLALSGTAFAANQLTGWEAAKAVDGEYDRNNSSWIASEDLSHIGVALDEAQTIDRVAFSNPFGNRAQGVYTVQTTTVANPDENTPAQEWQTQGVVRVGQPYATRRLVQFEAPVNATGARVVVEAEQYPIAISELEVYAPAADPPQPGLQVQWNAAPGSGPSYGLRNVAPSAFVADGISLPATNVGNVFLAGQNVRIALGETAAQGARWELHDVDGSMSDAGSGVESPLQLGEQSVGWYSFQVYDAADALVYETPLAVLPPLPPETAGPSPVALDVAAAWFARDYVFGQARYMELAHLAGVSWVRDRLSWQEIMPSASSTAGTGTTYDTSAEQAALKDLNVLQTFHSSPSWAIDSTLDPDNPGRRFPRDLFDLHAFCQLLAQRFESNVQAWEPWNEANIKSFGGHLINEMCTLQKAAWWGFKSAAPELTVSWNNYSGPGSDLHHEGVLRNRAYGYFDSYNFHIYAPPSSYAEAIAPLPAAAAGRPIWLTESGIQLDAVTEAPESDLSAAGELEQARFAARSVASSLWAGVDKHFFFILGNYRERGFQYGLLRHDATPRPAYVALAQTARALAGANPLGRSVQSGAHVYAFRAEPMGTPRDVFVLWADASEPWPLPPDIAIESVYDLYGRQLADPPSMIGTDPIFVVAPQGASAEMQLEAAVEPQPFVQETPCPIVMQAVMHQDASVLSRQAYQVEVGVPAAVPVRVYNFGETTASGSLAVVGPQEGWSPEVDAAQPLEIPPGESRMIQVSATLPAAGESSLYGDWLTLTGDFGELGESVLAFRLAGDPADISPTVRTPIPGAMQPDRWVPNKVAGATLDIRSSDGGVLFDMHFPSDVDPWSYPRFYLTSGEEPPVGAVGLSLDVQLLPNSADATIRLQFVESGGSAYLAETGVARSSRELEHVVVFFEEATWMAASATDADGKLTPADITQIKLGVNGTADADVDLWFSDLAWNEY